MWMGWDGIGCDGIGLDGMGWDGMGWDGIKWDDMVIIGHRFSKSTFGANKFHSVPIC